MYTQAIAPKKQSKTARKNSVPSNVAETAQ